METKVCVSKWKQKMCLKNRKQQNVSKHTRKLPKRNGHKIKFPIINGNNKMCQTGNKNLFPHTNKIETANLCGEKKMDTINVSHNNGKQKNVSYWKQKFVSKKKQKQKLLCWKKGGKNVSQNKRKQKNVSLPEMIVHQWWEWRLGV